MKNKSLIKSSFVISSFTFLSRIFGLVRDIVKSWLFGTGFEADAFTAAFRFPNLLRRLLAEGAFSAAFVPIYSSYLVTKDKEETKQFLSAVASLMTLLLIFISLAGMALAPVIVRIFTPGFASVPGKLELASELTRIMFPYIFFISLVSLSSGVLHSHSRFAAPAFGPVLLNLSMIAFALTAYYTGQDIHGRIVALAFGVLAGGILQLLVNWAALKRTGTDLLKLLRLGFRHSGLAVLWRRIVPGIFGALVYEINMLVDTVLASLLVQGSISALEYGNRLMQLPLGVFGIALGTAVLPGFSRLAAEDKKDELLENYYFAQKAIIMLMTIFTAVLVVCGSDIISLLFQYGRFSAEKSLPMTYFALAMYALGLPAFSSMKIIAPVFYAFGDTKTPVRIAAYSLVLNVILNVTLMQVMAHAGLALATSATAFFQAGYLTVLLRKQYLPDLKPMEPLKYFLTKLPLFAVFTGALWGAKYLGVELLTGDGLLERAVRVMLPLTAGGIAFVLYCSIFKCSEFDGIKRMVLARLGKKK